MKTNKKIALGIGALLATGVGATAYENRKQLGEMGSLLKRGFEMYKNTKPSAEETREEQERTQKYRRFYELERERFERMMDREARLMNTLNRGMLGRTQRVNY